jgi:RNA polymerase sigma-70 factor (ECF subfamily)
MDADEATVRAWQAGRAACPDVDLDLERFTAHARTLDPGAIASYPADVYLAAACLANIDAALARFDREIVASARGTVQAIDANPGFVDDALQRLRTNLLVGDDAQPRLAMYAGRGPLRAWVGVVAARTALMLRRAQPRDVLVDEDDWTETLTTISTSNPELELLKRQYTAAFARAFRDAVAQLEPRQRAALRMSFVDGLSIDEIGEIYGVHRATTARWISRACDALFDTTRALLAERLELSQTELDRMTSLVRSQIDVTVSQLIPASIE